MGQITVKVERTASASATSSSTSSSVTAATSAELANIVARMSSASTVKVYDGYSATITLSMTPTTYVLFTRMPSSE